MDIVSKVEKFMKDNHLVQYYDLEASHKYEVEDSFNTGKNEGKKEGHKEGRKEGRKEGTQLEKYNIAKNLLRLNVDIPTIMKSTGLSKKEIEKLYETI